MRAMVLHAIDDIENEPLSLEEVADPAPDAGEVRVKVSVCGLCRTDLHVIEGDLERQQLPLIPGHQVVGVVDRLGDGCARLAEGDRVGIAWLRHTCGQCGYCESGRENLCPDSRFTGYHADGGYAGYAVVPEAFAYEIPDALGDDAAVAPLLCAGIVGYRALQRSRAGRGDRLAVYGFGSSAHIVAQIAIHRGCELYVVSRTASHRALAMEMGAAWAGEDAADMPRPAEAAILFAPVGRLVPTCLEHLAPGGTLSIAGIYLTPIPELDYEKHVFDERDIRSVTTNTREDGRALLAEAAEAGVTAHTVAYPLADANRGLADMKAGDIDGTGVLTVDG